MLASTTLDPKKLAPLLDPQSRGEAKRAHEILCASSGSGASAPDSSSPRGSLAAGVRAEALATPTTTASNDLAAGAGGHACSVAVGACPAEVVRLIRSLAHVETRPGCTPENKTIDWLGPVLGRRGRIDSSGHRHCQTATVITVISLGQVSGPLADSSLLSAWPRFLAHLRTTHRSGLIGAN